MSLGVVVFCSSESTAVGSSLLSSASDSAFSSTGGRVSTAGDAATQLASELSTTGCIVDERVGDWTKRERKGEERREVERGRNRGNIYF